MKTLTIDLQERSYPIYISNCYNDLYRTGLLEKLKGKKVVIVTDSNVDVLYCGEVTEIFNNAAIHTEKLVIPAGEEHKNLDTVKSIYRYLYEKKIDRTSAVVALGGGVTGDIAGFAASTYLRGIKYIQFPTSLLAQADSSVGGKVGVDFERSKNMVGSFYQPELVYINTHVLKTLPDREIMSGLAETIKHGLIADKDFFSFIESNIDDLLECKADVMLHTAFKNCSIKGSVVQEDEKESGLRAILNFGHTFGHAIESVSQFKISHGECVAVGIIAAYELAEKMRRPVEKQRERVENLLIRSGFKLKAEGLDVMQVLEQMSNDKKVRDGILKFILPVEIGRVDIVDIPNREMIKLVLQSILI